MSIREQYKQSLKNTKSEEFFDLLIFRPLGFLTALGFKKTKITPNQITIFGILWGILSGLAYYFHSYELGAIFIIISNIFDCADGQLARMKKSSSKIGRILDGFSDYITFLAIYLGATLAYVNEMGHFKYFWFGLIAGAATSVHAMIFDDYQSRYASSSSINEIESEIEESKRDKKEAKNLFHKILFGLYVSYLKKQKKLRKKDVYISDKLMRLLTFIGPTTHITLLVIFSFVHRLNWFFYAITIVLTLYLVVILSLKKVLNKKKV